MQPLSRRVWRLGALPLNTDVPPSLAVPEFHIRERPQMVAQLASSSNLGALDFGSDVAPPADWSPPTSSFEPGVRVDPSATFACVLLGIFGVDAALESMSVPFLGRRIRNYIKSKKEAERERQIEELRRLGGESTDDDAGG
eukprot:jgi/Tetstr1/454692/TSEL_041581.t1